MEPVWSPPPEDRFDISSDIILQFLYCNSLYNRTNSSVQITGHLKPDREADIALAVKFKEMKTSSRKSETMHFHNLAHTEMITVHLVWPFNFITYEALGLTLNLNRQPELEIWGACTACEGLTTVASVCTQTEVFCIRSAFAGVPGSSCY